MTRVSLVSQNLYKITIDVGNDEITFDTEAFERWLIQHNPNIFTLYSYRNLVCGTFDVLDIVSFNNDEDALKYYLQFLQHTINNEIDKWQRRKENTTT